MLDLHMLEMEAVRDRAEVLDAVDAGRAEAVDADPAKDDRVAGIAGRQIDDDAVEAGVGDAGNLAVAADRDRLRDRDGAETARIEHVDLAARGGLADRAREGLAGRGAAARIGIVADAGHPRTRRLGTQRSGDEQTTKDCENEQNSILHVETSS